MIRLSPIKTFLAFLVVGSVLTGCALTKTAGPLSFLSPAHPTTPLTSPTTASLPTSTPTFVPPAPTVTLAPQLSPIVILQPTSATPSGPTPKPLSQKFPIAQLNVNSPGPNSRIASPLSISAYALPGDQGKVTVQLWGEDGSLIAEQLIKLGTSTSGWVTFTTQFPFEITSAGEAALLTLTTYDGYSRRIAVNSVPLLLLQVGNSAIENTGFTQEPFVVQSPAASSTVSGGVLHLAGYAHACSSAAVIVELIKTSGGIVASRQIGLKPASAGNGYIAFSADLPYSVNTATPVRLSLRQMTDQAPLKDCALSSILITLQP